MRKKQINRFLRQQLTRIVSLGLLALSTSTLAQQYDQWAFGHDASMDLNAPGPNVYLPTAPTPYAIEGCASYCNANGDLWFYTNGKDVKNYILGTTCTNCLNGMVNNTRASQGVVIVPKVGGAAHEFYIFTVSDYGSLNNGLSYVEYNANTNTVSAVTTMGLAAGTFGSFCQERVQAVPHCNGTDYWVVVKPVIGSSYVGGGSPALTAPVGGSNTSLYAYHVSNTGVDGNPVVSDAGYAASMSPSFNHIGDAKFSPNKELYATALRTGIASGETHLSRFNCATGKFVHLQSMPYISGRAAISVSFSPNSQVLYVSGHNVTWQGSLRQYDLSGLKCDPYSTPPSCDHFIGFSSGSLPYLQLGTDGIIYRSRYASNYVDAILSPNAIGCTNMNYDNLYKLVSGTSGNSVSFGLPNNIDGLVSNPTPGITVCPGSCGEYTFWLTGCSANLTWNFGDGSGIVSGSADLILSSTLNTGPMTMPTHTFPSTGGTYMVTVTGDNFTLNTFVTVPPNSTPAPTFATIGFPVCSGSNTNAVVSVLNSANYTTIDWTDCSTGSNTYVFPNATGSSYSFSAANVPGGTYSLCATGTTSNGCTATSTYTFTVGAGAWPKTTTSTNNYDNARRTETDQYDNVYVCGEFRAETTFDGLTITGNPNAILNAYLTKYNNCSDIQWVAKTSSTEIAWRHSMSTNEALGHIYVTGRCEGSTTFYPGQTPSNTNSCPGSVPITINGEGVYVAIYDYNGCLLDVHMEYDNAMFKHVSAHVTSSVSFAGQNRVYLAINETPLNQGNNVRMRVLGYQQVGTILDLNWIREFTSSVAVMANDIDAFETTVAVTGYFQRDMIYANPGPTPLGGNANVPEAYVFGMLDGGSFASTIPDFSQRMNTAISGPSASYGHGVEVRDPNTVFLTGTFTGKTKYPFDIQGMLAYNAYSNVETNAYAIGIYTNNNLSWYHTIWNKDGNARGHAVKAVGSQVYFTGDWDGEIFFIDNTALQFLNVENHMYVVSMGDDGDFMNANSWQNHSEYAANGQNHISAVDITASSDMIFVAGKYQGKYGMMNDIAVNSPIQSTNGMQGNMFLWRYDFNQNGISKMHQNNDESDVINVSTLSEVRVYPNPVKDMFTIEWPEMDTETIVEVYNMQGQIILSNKTFNTNMRLDSRPWNSGLYLMTITQNGKTIQKRHRKKLILKP